MATMSDDCKGSAEILVEQTQEEAAIKRCWK